MVHDKKSLAMKISPSYYLKRNNGKYLNDLLLGINLSKVFSEVKITNINLEKIYWK